MEEWFLDETGGLVCAIEDQTTAIQWYNGVGSSDISTAVIENWFWSREYY
jgi:hypothetical protein